MSKVSSLSLQSKIFIKFSLNQNLAESMGQISKCLLGFYSVRTKANFYWLQQELIWDRSQKAQWKPRERLKSQWRFFPVPSPLSTEEIRMHSHQQEIFSNVVLPKSFCKPLSSSFNTLLLPALLFTHVTPSFHPFLQHEQIFFAFPSRFWGGSRKAETLLVR